MKNVRYFAIRVGNYVELRVASEPLLTRVSSLTRSKTTQTYRYEYHENGMVKNIIPVQKEVKKVFKQVFFSGGESVAWFPAAAFELGIGQKVFKDVLLELNEAQAGVILDPVWTKKKKVW